MNASKLARWAAVPTAAIVATTAGVALAQDDADEAPASVEGSAPADADAELVTAVKAFLATGEGQELLADAAGTSDALRAEVDAVKAAVDGLTTTVQDAAGEREALTATLADLRAEVLELEQAIHDKDGAHWKLRWNEKTDGEDRGWDAKASDQDEAKAYDDRDGWYDRDGWGDGDAWDGYRDRG